MLTSEQAAGLLQRFMPNRDAVNWLENDRRYQPMVPFQRDGEAIRYVEDDLVRFVRQIDKNAMLRSYHDRRGADERRSSHAERRDENDRRGARRRARNDLDRRFAVRNDRRCELDRRIRGWVDRRCVLERRASIEVAELLVEHV